MSWKKKKKAGSVFSLLQVRKQEFREEAAPRAVQSLGWEPTPTWEAPKAVSLCCPFHPTLVESFRINASFYFASVRTLAKWSFFPSHKENQLWEHRKQQDPPYTHTARSTGQRVSCPQSSGYPGAACMRSDNKGSLLHCFLPPVSHRGTMTQMFLKTADSDHLLSTPQVSALGPIVKPSTCISTARQLLCQRSNSPQLVGAMAVGALWTGLAFVCLRLNTSRGHCAEEPKKRWGKPPLGLICMTILNFHHLGWPCRRNSHTQLPSLSPRQLTV